MGTDFLIVSAGGLRVVTGVRGENIVHLFLAFTIVEFVQYTLEATSIDRTILSLSVF